MFSLFLYLLVIKGTVSGRKYQSLMVTLFSVIAIYLCMTTPIVLVTGGIMDLRIVPWSLAFIYGGFTVGLIVTAFLFVYRIVIGGVGVLTVLTVYPIGILLFYKFVKGYPFFSFKKKLTRVLFTILIIVLLVIFSIQVTVNPPLAQVLLFYFFFGGLHLILISICIYIIETLIEKDMLKKQIEKAEKLNIVGQMAASIAHEIRNPLTVVHGFMQLLNQAEDIHNDYKEHIKIMMTELGRAQTIISDYLTLAKPEAETLVPIDVKQQVEQIVQTIRPFAFMKNVVLTLTFSGEGAVVFGNVKKIQQVIVNVLKNAIEASPENSSVAVILHADSQYTYIRIEDNGHGLTEDEIDRLGTPFYSMKEKGTGLGLTVTYSIVKSMNGCVQVESKKGVGTTFVIWLPVYKPVKEEGNG